MCGIYFFLGRDKSESPGTIISQELQNRGPDSFKVLKQFPPHHQDLPGESNQTVYMTFASSVLSLRGDQIITQPVTDDNSESVLCWNGEAWQIGGCSVTCNDSEAVFALLQEAAACSISQDDNGRLQRGSCSSDCFCSSLAHVIRAINNVSGPYAFIFLDAHHRRVLFARDPLGRRSLLHRTTTSGELIISSVSDGNTSNHWEEVEADGIYVINLSMAASSLSSIYSSLGHHRLQDSSFDMIKVPWSHANAVSNIPILPLSLVSMPS